jgi:hypothetical protein
MSAPPVRMLGLEDRLAADPEGNERDAIVGQLHDAYRMFKRELDDGARTERYFQLVALIVAIDEAMKVVPSLWAHLQPGPNASRSQKG